MPANIAIVCEIIITPANFINIKITEGLRGCCFPKCSLRSEEDLKRKKIPLKIIK